MKIRAALLLLAALLAYSCASKPQPAPATPPPPAGFLDKQGIIDRFKAETGLHILEEVKAVEYFQNEISPGIRIVKFTLFLSENDAASVLAQKPPFSSEWTHGDIYKDFRDEWLNLQRLKLAPYAQVFKNERIDPKPVLEKGYVSKTGSLQEGDRVLKILFVNRDYCTIVYYMMKNG